MLVFLTLKFLSSPKIQAHISHSLPIPASQIHLDVKTKHPVTITTETCICCQFLLDRNTVWPYRAKGFIRKDKIHTHIHLFRWKDPVTARDQSRHNLYRIFYTCTLNFFENEISWNRNTLCRPIENEQLFKGKWLWHPNIHCDTLMSNLFLLNHYFNF